MAWQRIQEIDEAILKRWLCLNEVRQAGSTGRFGVKAVPADNTAAHGFED